MSSTRVTRLSAKEAKRFFLKQSSYANFDYPFYIHFDQLLKFVNAEVGSQKLPDLCKKDSSGKRIPPSKFEDVNYRILSNKDGAYSWRQLELVHPVLYIDLINLLTKTNNWKEITEKFADFSTSSVNCISIPRESETEDSDTASSIKNWWENIEQQSLRKALEFDYIYSTDITNCYPSIYTHSMEWALHPRGKDGVKIERAKGRVATSLGSEIDARLRNMNNGQTNGIPQGSVVMDFLAELLLGYSDTKLTERLDDQKIKRADYHILRFRDDYRILTNSPPIGHVILRELNLVLYELGLKMNPGKTHESDDIISAGIKPEKIDLIVTGPIKQSYQKEAFRIYQISKKYPNAGVVLKELDDYFQKVDRVKYFKDVDLEVLISIFTMTAIKSPRTINWCSAIISKLLEHVDDKQHKIIVEKIINKFSSLPNVGFIDLWLQRISAPLGLRHTFVDNLTELALHNIRSSQLWNCNWLNEDVVKTLDAADVSELPHLIATEEIKPTIQRAEVEMFKVSYRW